MNLCQKSWPETYSESENILTSEHQAFNPMQGETSKNAID